MNPIEIPLVDAPVDDSDPVAFVDYVLGQLIATAPASIESSHNPSSNHENVDWRITAPNKTNTVFAKNLRRRYRHALARIGHHYLNNQLYCGFANCVLTFGEHRALCFIYLGNCSDTGFWLRAYSRPVDA